MPRKPTTTKSVPTTTQKLYYLQWLDDGMTFQGAVWRRGSVTTTTDEAFAIADEAAQIRSYGRPMYRLLDKAEYEHLSGGVTVPAPQRNRTTPAVPVNPTHEGIPSITTTTEEAPAPEPAPGADDGAAPFDGYGTMTDEETLDALATMGDESLDAFVSYEKAHRNRTEILAAVADGE